MKNRHLGKIIGLYVLLFVTSFGSAAGQLMQQDLGYDVVAGYGLLLTLFDLLLLSFIMMVIPGICVLAGRGKMEYKKGNRICWLNSMLLFVTSTMTMALTGISFVGALGAVAFYFINKWVFVQDQEISAPKATAVETDETLALEQNDHQNAEEPCSEDEAR